MSLTSSPDVSLVLLSLLPLLCCGQFPLPGRGQFPGGVGGPRGVSSVEDLIDTIPGVPGDDYPIYATVSSTTLLSPCDSTSSLLPQVPDSSFTCPGRVDGGYYSDPEADCQAFHICAGDGTGGLTKYSFLCPNGTLFNQQYFVCDWWFNVDCSLAEDLYSLNDEYAAEREANSPPEGGQSQYGGGNGGGRSAGGNGGRAGGRGGNGGSRRGSASAPRGSYAAPSDSYAFPEEVGAAPAGGYGAPAGGGYSAPGRRRNARQSDTTALSDQPEDEQS